MMKSNSDAEKKLARLREEYYNNLPLKIIELENLLQGVVNHWNITDATLLHRKIHSLHGSAKIYGYAQIGESAANIETFLKMLLSISNPSEEQKKHLIKLFSTLNGLVSITVSSNQSFQLSKESQAHLLNEVIYFLETDSRWANDVIQQIEAFGYTVKYFEHINSFIEAIGSIQKFSQAVLLIDMKLLDPPLETALQNINHNHNYKNTSVFFIAPQGDYLLRFKAVQLGGNAFFVRSFLIEDLIKKLDNAFQNESESYRILIVDDEREVADYHSAILNQEKMITHIITQSQHIDTALNEFKPDLILMDLYMPDCSGMQLAYIIRQQSAYESIPIMFLSSEEDRLVQLNAMKLGVDDFITKSSKPDYLVLAIKNRISRYNSLRSMIVRDNLTGLYNHSFIHQQLDIQVHLAVRTNASLCVVMIDLDDFKIINDTHGHQVGDQVLRNLGLMMRKRLRLSDVVGRYGGEEFLIILPNTSIESARVLINDLRIHFSQLIFSLSTINLQVTFSAGISDYPTYQTSLELIQAADKKLYESKNSGKNRVL